jgi:hypothetical protein
MAVAIYLGSTYLINFALSRSPAPQKASGHADEAKFRSLLKAGNQAIQSGRYSDALASFLAAERSADQLSDDQYESLKKSRLQIAQIYESSGNNSEAERVYRALATCAIRQGQALLGAKQLEQTLARGQDAEQFSNRLSEGKRDALQQSVYLLVNSLTGLQRYPEAVQAQQRMIDYLRASADDFDKAFSDAYLNLASTYAEAKDWRGFERALGLAIDSCDRTLAHFSADSNQVLVGSTLINKNWAQYNLVIAYYREGNTDFALSKAEDLFAEASQKPQDPLHPVNVAYHAGDFAALALQIATEAKRRDAIDVWQKRAGNVMVIGFRANDSR